MKRIFCFIVLITASLILMSTPLSKAQFDDHGLVIRSGINFQYYNQDSPFSSLPENHQDKTEKFGYYFTPGIEKFVGKGFYVGLEGRMGAAKVTAKHIENNTVLQQAETNLNLYGGGILLRKHFNVSKKFSPFLGLGASYYKEKGESTSNGNYQNVNRNNFYTDLQIGAHYRISPKFGVEAYFTPGGLLISKSLEHDYPTDVQPNFGNEGHALSLGINYFLHKK